jgi:hypothetical protein
MIKLCPSKDGNWEVWKGRKLLRVFTDKSDAQDFCVGLHTDLLWERSNRD